MEDELSMVNAKRGKEMTRETQTMWIVGAIALALWAILFFMTRLPESNDYAKCQRIIGPMDQQCKSDVAIKHLSRGY